MISVSSKIKWEVDAVILSNGELNIDLCAAFW